MSEQGLGKGNNFAEPFGADTPKDLEQALEKIQIREQSEQMGKDFPDFDTTKTFSGQFSLGGLNFDLSEQGLKVKGFSPQYMFMNDQSERLETEDLETHDPSSDTDKEAILPPNGFIIINNAQPLMYRTVSNESGEKLLEVRRYTGSEKEAFDNWQQEKTARQPDVLPEDEARKQANKPLGEWKEVLGAELKTAFEAVKVRDWKDFLTLSLASVGDALPGMKWVPLALAGANTVVMLGSEAYSGFKAYKNSQDMERFLKEYDGLLKPLLELFGVKSKNHEEVLDFKTRGLAVGLGVTSSVLGLVLSEMSGKAAALPGLNVFVKRLAFRGITQYLAPRVISEVAGIFVSKKIDSKKADQFMELSNATISSTTVILTTAMMAKGIFGSHERVVESQDQAVGEVAAVTATSAVIEASRQPTNVPTQAPTELPTQVATEVPTIEPTLTFDLGWHPGEASNLDELISTAQENNLVVTRGDMQYFYLDQVAGPDMVIQGDNYFVLDTDGLFKLDLNDDGVLDDVISLKPENFIPADLLEKNVNSAGHLERPALELVNLPMAETLDINGDGDPEIMTIDGQHYMDTDNSGDINTSVDALILNKPEMTISTEGFTIDKIELSNGSVWTDLELTIDPSRGGIKLTDGNIDYADGSSWDFGVSESGEIVVQGTLANGQNLAMDTSVSSISTARYQYELAKLHPEWSPDKVASVAYRSKIDGVDINQLAGVAVPVSTPAPSAENKTSFWTYNQDGELVGIVNETQVLSTNASGGWNGIIQGEIIREVGNSIQTFVTPSTLGGTATRAYQAADITSSPSLETSFSDLSKSQQNIIHFTFNHDVMQFNLNNYLFANLPDNLNSADVKDLVVEYLSQEKIPADRFLNRINFDDFEEWLKQKGYKI